MVLNNLGEIRKWKNIAKFLGVSEQTARKYHKKYGMPILRTPAVRYGLGTPILIPELYYKWLLKAEKLLNIKK